METMTANKTKQALVPKLRFRDYGGEWKKTKIGQILKIGSGKDYKHLDTGIIPVFGTGGLMTKVNKPLFSGETVFIGRKGSIDKPFYFNGDFWTVDTLFYTHNFNSSIPKFVYCLFQKINWYVHNEASGVPSLSKKTIESIQIILPSLPEQQKIASFLSAVDEKIQLLIRKKELLENYKKGSMQQLFSQKLRFKDDTSTGLRAGNGIDFPDWEEKRLGDVLDKTSTGLNPRDNFVLGSGNNNYVTIKNITNGRIDFSSCEKIDDIALSLIRKRSGLRKNDIIMSSIGNIGEAYLLDEDPLNWNINESVFMLRASISLLPIYLYYLVTNDYSKWYFESNSTGSSFKSIKLGALKLLPIGLPSKKEQQKIASFLSAIDEKIEAVNQQITQSQTFKRGLLQKMFV